MSSILSFYSGYTDLTSQAPDGCVSPRSTVPLYSTAVPVVGDDASGCLTAAEFFSPARGRGGVTGCQFTL